MSIEVVKKEAMVFTGYVKEIKANENKNNASCRAYWGEIFQNNLYNALYEQSDDLNVVGVRYGYDMATGNFKFMIGVRGKGKQLPDTEQLVLEEGLYAVNSLTGPMPDTIENGIKDTHKWLSTSNYNHSGSAEIEIYTEGDVNDKNYVSYFWMSVK